jgi:predicted metal-dependent phosphotriesterase family hydrolase
MVETVGGPVDAGALGVTLPHWDEDVRVADAIEKLAVARAGGIETIVDQGRVLEVRGRAPRDHRRRDRRPGRLPGLRPLRHRALQHNPRSHPHPARSHRRGPDLLRINGWLLPALRDGGVTEEQIAQMMVENPRRFLAGV